MGPPKLRVPHTNSENPGVTDSEQSDLKLDSATVLPTRNLIPIYLQKYQPKCDAVSKYQKVNGDL